MILDVRTSDDSLRQEKCQENVFQIAPSWFMRADALAQYLFWKHWRQWVFVRAPPMSALPMRSSGQLVDSVATLLPSRSTRSKLDLDMQLLAINSCSSDCRSLRRGSRITAWGLPLTRERPSGITAVQHMGHEAGGRQAAVAGIRHSRNIPPRTSRIDSKGELAGT